MSSIYVETQPESHQAACANCGWHTLPLKSRKRAEHFGKQHESVCPNPPPPRNGATASCGCWWYATLGTTAGFTHAECPLHGRRRIEACNVPCPQPDPGGDWVPVQEKKP